MDATVTPAPTPEKAVAGWRRDRGRPALAEDACLPRPRLSGRGRLYGSGQLGDLARRRFQVRLRAADGRAVVEPDGDPVAGFVRAARHRLRPRSGAGLPRRVSARGVVAA